MTENLIADLPDSESKFRWLNCVVFSMLNVIFVFQVWASVPPWKQGSLAEFVTLTEYEVSYRASRVIFIAMYFHNQLTDKL